MSKTTRNVAIVIIAVVFLTLSFGSGYILGTERAATSTDTGIGLDLRLVEQAWGLIQRDYVDKDKLSQVNLTHAAIQGIVDAVDDPHTSYLEPDIYKLGLSSMEGKFDGIGAQVATKDKQIIIVAPFPDSPADKAGIRSGDIILEIDGGSTRGMSLTEAVLKIRGEKGTSVRLRLLHTNQTQPVDLEIVRGEIKVASVLSEMRGDTAIIRITHFAEPTARELAPVIASLSQKGARGIILDLRSNPGGLLQVVVEVAGYFLREGVAVQVVDSKGQKTTLPVRAQGVVTPLPLVILVDKYSASGSEVLSGALRDNGRAVIAGTTTYGKGSVNVFRNLDDGSGLAITTARWLTPKGDLIEGRGLEPDYKLEAEGEAAIEWAIQYLKKS